MSINETTLIIGPAEEELKLSIAQHQQLHWVHIPTPCCVAKLGIHPEAA
jgi:hypothetical protein